MSPEELHQKQLIKGLIEHILWSDIRKSIRQQIMEDMLTATKSEDREALFWEAQAFDRLVGRLTSIANEVRWENNAA